MGRIQPIKIDREPASRGRAVEVAALLNLGPKTAAWLDAAGISLADVRPYSTFGLEQVGNDVYLTFVAVPEPSSLILVGIGVAAAAWAARRRRASAATNGDLPNGNPRVK